MKDRFLLNIGYELTCFAPVEGLDHMTSRTGIILIDGVKVERIVIDSPHRAIQFHCADGTYWHFSRDELKHDARRENDGTYYIRHGNGEAKMEFFAFAYRAFERVTDQLWDYD